MTHSPSDESKHESKQFKPAILWPNVFIISVLHITALYGFYLFIFSVKWSTIMFTLALYVMSGIGVTAGSHRLWSHRSYKATTPLRVLLCIFHTIACQRDVYEWSRDHRIHHKYTETDADPHNVNRGFFFAHVGWLLLERHPKVIEKSKGIDCSDLLNDPVVYYQKKYYIPLVAMLCFILPTLIPYYFWNETPWNAFFVCSIFRLCYTLNVAFCVNSVAHIWGNKPYDNQILSTENKIISFWAVGEGYHNYHHTFPWDYSTSEFGWKVNPTTLFIDACARLGLVYDRKSATPAMIEAKKLKSAQQQQKEQQMNTSCNGNNAMSANHN